jgi:gas vesicle protein
VDAKPEGRSRLRSFLIGGLVGASAGLAAARRLRPSRGQRRPTPGGLAAFDDAPCYRELIEREAREARESRERA